MQNRHPEGLWSAGNLAVVQLFQSVLLSVNCPTVAMIVLEDTSKEKILFPQKLHQGVHVLTVSSVYYCCLVFLLQLCQF